VTEIVIFVALFVMILAASLKTIPEHERGVILRLGRVIRVQGPGLVFVLPAVDKMIRLNLLREGLAPDTPDEILVERALGRMSEQTH
jgi:regulator of protease activity HflC (stomatin/prohibitin superfamily)